MREVYFHNNGADHDVGNFLISLGDYQHIVLEDLCIIAHEGPEALECGERGRGVWEYRRAVAPGRYAVLLFALLSESNVYIVLHGFRAGREGTARHDLRHAYGVLKAYR